MSVLCHVYDKYIVILYHWSLHIYSLLPREGGEGIDFLLKENLTTYNQNCVQEM